MCTGQHGSVNGSRKFQILRGVKQGHILSPLLFNAGLEEAVRSWRNRLGTAISKVAQRWITVEPPKTKTLTTKQLTSPTFLDVDGDMIFVLHGKDQHHYLGRVLFGNLRNCSAVECYPRCVE